MHAQSANAVLSEQDQGASRPLQPGRAPDHFQLQAQLKEALVARAFSRLPITYRRLRSLLPALADGETDALRDALEQLMEEDVRAGRPLVAALAVGALDNGLPAPWFFRKAESLGKFAGPFTDLEAFAFHARELHRSISHYGRGSGQRTDSKARDHTVVSSSERMENANA